MSIATEITRLLNAKSAIATSIANKGVNVPSGTKLDGMSTLIDSILVGGGQLQETESVSEKDINFVDYDGTIVASYTLSEFSLLTALPANPSHTGLTALGWNWTLSDAKTYVATFKKLTIGLQYVTTDGKTHVHIHTSDAWHNGYVGVAVNGTVTIEWGDGVSENSTLTGTSLSTIKYVLAPYTSSGDYVIKIAATSGSYCILGVSTHYSRLYSAYSSTGGVNRKYNFLVKEVYLGSNCTVGAYAFAMLCEIECLTLPTTITSTGTYAFYSLRKIKSISIPSGTTSIGTYGFSYNYANFISLPKSFKTLSNYLFRYAYHVRTLCFTNSVTSTAIQTYSLDSLYTLEHLVIPPSVTSITSTGLSNHYAIKEIFFTSTTPPTVANGVFTNLPTSCVIYVPEDYLSTYTSEDNYPDSNVYTYVEY